MGGGLAWRRDLGSGPALASLLVADGALYAGTEGGILFALDSTTGVEHWEVDVGGAITRGPAFGDGVLYVGAAGGGFTAIDVATRAIRWTADLGAGEVARPPSARAWRMPAAASSPLTRTMPWSRSTSPTDRSPGGGRRPGAGRRTWAGSPMGACTPRRRTAARRADALTGKQIWADRFGENLPSLVSIVDDVLYLSAEPRSVRAVDARSGVEFWNVEVVGNASMPAVVDGRVFVGTNLGRVVAIGDSDTSSAAP